MTTKHASFLCTTALMLVAATGCGGKKPNPAPAAPTGLGAVFAPGTGDVDLTWTNPPDADLAGVIVIRSTSGSVTDVPADGQQYAVGDVLPNGGVVVFVGTGTSGTDANPAVAVATYAAFAFDSAGHFSGPSNEATVIVPLPLVQAASLTIDLTDPVAPTLSVGTQPPSGTLSGSVSLKPATYLNDGGDEGELLFVAQAPGAAGNSATIALVDGGDAATLAVSTVGQDVSVTLDRYTHTAGQIAALINGDAAASAVLRAIAPVDGQRVTTIGVTPLSGGSDTEYRVWLSFTNGAERALNNAKAVVTAASVGTVTSRFTTTDAEPLFYFGYTGVDVGETSTQGYIDIAAVGAATAIDVDLNLEEAAMAIVSGGWDDSFVMADASGSGADVEISSEPTGFQGYDADSRNRDGFVSADGRTLILGNHNMPTIVAVDVTTLRPAVSVDLDDGSGVGHVDSVVPSPGMDFAYAVVTFGAHAAFWEDSGADNASVCDVGPDCLSAAEQVDLVKLSLPGLTEVGRLTLVNDSAVGARGRKLSMTADGGLGAVALNREGTVAIVDLDAMALVQAVDVSAYGTFCQFAAISPDGTQTFVAFKDYDLTGLGLPDEINQASMAVIDHADWSVAPLAPEFSSDGHQPGFLEFGPDGALYYGRKDMDTAHAFSVYDLGTATWDAIDVGIDGAAGIEFISGGRAYVYDTNNETVVLVDLASQTELLTTDVDGASFGHKMIVSPY